MRLMTHCISTFSKYQQTLVLLFSANFIYTHTYSSNNWVICCTPVSGLPEFTHSSASWPFLNLHFLQSDICCMVIHGTGHEII